MRLFNKTTFRLMLVLSIVLIAGWLGLQSLIGGIVIFTDRYAAASFSDPHYTAVWFLLTGGLLWGFVGMLLRPYLR